MAHASRPDPQRGVYGISVAADLAGTGVQNLRLYERRGLLHPIRSPGGTRLYSRRDIHRLIRIGKLLTLGLVRPPTFGCPVRPSPLVAD